MTVYIIRPKATSVERSQGNEEIRAIIALGVQNQVKADLSNLEPSDFPSHQAYRQALIDRRKRQLANEVGDTIQSLRNFQLKILGRRMLLPNS